MKAKRTNIIKKQGTKTLAGILAVCMTFGTPISVLADDNTSDSTDGTTGRGTKCTG